MKSRVKTNTTFNLNYFNDFYVLEAIKANLSMKFSEKPELMFSHSIERLTLDLNAYQKELENSIAARVFVYIWAACMGEARHAANNMAKNTYIQEVVGFRGEAFLSSLEYEPNTRNIDKLIEIFKQPWRGSFGGKKWLKIAEALRMYKNVPEAAFIDHVIDLQHNTGTVFNKPESRSTILFETSYDGHFGTFLDYKFRRNILKYPPEDTMLVTKKTRALLDRYEVILKTSHVKWVRGKLQKLDEYEVKWGDDEIHLTKKWADWADCQKGNVPNLEEIFYKKGFDEVHVYNITEKELKKAINKIAKRCKVMVKSFGADYIKQVDKLAKSKYNRYVRHCKLEKAAVTYTNIPVKVKTDKKYHSTKITIQVPIEFYGYGTETEYGFEIVGDAQGINEQGRELGFDGQPGFSDGSITPGDYKLNVWTTNNHWYLKDKKLEVILA